MAYTSSSCELGEIHGKGTAMSRNVLKELRNSLKIPVSMQCYQKSYKQIKIIGETTPENSKMLLKKYVDISKGTVYPDIICSAKSFTEHRKCIFSCPCIWNLL
jgi:hypothetical protein